MAKPSKKQAVELNKLRDFVIEVMSSMDFWSKEALTKLLDIDLGVLRRNATQRHGVTRWRKGIAKPTKPEEVDVIDLHPRLLTDEWMPYAGWVLHHEFVHAMGYTAHDAKFRALESMWPSVKSSKMGLKFTEVLRREIATWLWFCEDCGKEYPRQKKGRGRYMCRECKTVLKDLPANPAQ